MIWIVLIAMLALGCQREEPPQCNPPHSTCPIGHICTLNEQCEVVVLPTEHEITFNNLIEGTEKSEMEPVTLCELPPGVALPFIHRCVFYGQTLSFANGRLFFTEEPYRDMTLTYIDTQEQLGYSIVQATAKQLEWYQRQERAQKRLGRAIVEVTQEEVTQHDR